MIDKPPRFKDLFIKKEFSEFEAWNQQVRDRFNNYIQSIFFPVSSLGTGSYQLHGKHPSMQLQTGETAYISCVIPHSISKFREAGIRIIPSGTGAIDYTVNLSYGGIGEDENSNTKTQSATSVSVTDDQLLEIDIPIVSIFTDQDPGDQIGIEIILDGVSTTTDIHVLGFYLKFS